MRFNRLKAHPFQPVGFKFDFNLRLYTEEEALTAMAVLEFATAGGSVVGVVQADPGIESTPVSKVQPNEEKSCPFNLYPWFCV